jgi:putative membrane protein
MGKKEAAARRRPCWSKEVRTMMWGWGAGWWLVAAVFMVVCLLMMGRMMGHGHPARGGHDRGDEPERILADRLAKGEIDVEEYERLLETLQRADHSASP